MRCLLLPRHLPHFAMDALLACSQHTTPAVPCCTYSIAQQWRIMYSAAICGHAIQVMIVLIVTGLRLQCECSLITNCSYVRLCAHMARWVTCRPLVFQCRYLAHVNMDASLLHTACICYTSRLQPCQFAQSCHPTLASSRHSSVRCHQSLIPNGLCSARTDCNSSQHCERSQWQTINTATMKATNSANSDTLHV